MEKKDERAESSVDEARKRRERRRLLIERLNQIDNFVPRERQPGAMSEEELSAKIERQRANSRRSFGQVGGGI